MCRLLNRTKRTKRDTKRQNLLTLLTLKNRKVHDSLYSGSHVPSHCAYSANFQFPADQFLSYRSHGNAMRAVLSIS